MTKLPTEYWFARRFPIGHARRGLSPIHWKGWMVVAIFVLGLLGGAALWAWFAGRDEMWKGVASFAAIACIFGLWFVGVANKKADHANTAADYREGRVRV